MKAILNLRTIDLLRVKDVSLTRRLGREDILQIHTKGSYGVIEIRDQDLKSVHENLAKAVNAIET